MTARHSPRPGGACTALSWRYAVWDRLDGVLVANQRWLAGYRHPRCFDEHIAARLLEVFNGPRALMDGAELVGDPLGVLPVLYHLLWKQLLVADLAVPRRNRHNDQSSQPPHKVNNLTMPGRSRLGVHRFDHIGVSGDNGLAFELAGGRKVWAARFPYIGQDSEFLNLLDA